MSIILRSSNNSTLEVFKATDSYFLLKDPVSGDTFQLFHRLLTQQQDDLFTRDIGFEPAYWFGKFSFTAMEKAWLQAIEAKEFYLIEFEERVGSKTFATQALCCADSWDAACQAVDFAMPTFRGDGMYNEEFDEWRYGGVSISVDRVTPTDKQTAIAAIRARIATLMLWV